MQEVYDLKQLSVAQEKEIAEKAKGIEEVHALIKSDFTNCFNSKEIEVLKANAVGMWRAIKQVMEEKK